MKKHPKPVLKKWEEFSSSIKLAQTDRNPNKLQKILIPIPNLRSPKLKLRFSNPLIHSMSSKKMKQETKYSELMEKIERVPETKNFSETIFRTKIKKSMRSLHQIDLDDQRETKEVVDAFSSIVKGKMFSISKPGIKFRKATLYKHIKGLQH